jgi:hypothetical protein
MRQGGLVRCEILTKLFARAAHMPHHAAESRT